MSLSAIYRTRAIAVILTGKDGNGALGVHVIKRYGGRVIAQDQATCECFSMPQAAISTGEVNAVLPLVTIAFRV